MKIDSDAGRPRQVLAVVLVSLAVVVSAVPSLNVALPGLARETGATQTELQWIIDAYALVFAGLLLPAGALGDRYGRKPVLVAGLAVFSAGALAASLAEGPEMLIAMRGVSGVGAALVMPTTLSIITSSFPAEERAKAVGAWVGVAGAGAVSSAHAHVRHVVLRHAGSRPANASRPAGAHPEPPRVAVTADRSRPRPPPANSRPGVCGRIQRGPSQS